MRLRNEIPIVGVGRKVRVSRAKGPEGEAPLRFPLGLTIVVVAIVMSPMVLLPSASAQTRGSGPGTPFAGKQASLQTLPPMQALPIPTERGRTASALYAPDYVDVETLRQSASLTAVAFGDSRHGVAVGQHGCVLISDDAGESWKLAPVSVHCPLLDVAWADEQTVLVVGGGIDLVTGISRGVVLLSRDAGESWGKLAEHELPRLTQVQFRDGRWFASGDSDPATGHRYFESVDGGSQWQSVAETRFVEAAREHQSSKASVEFDLRRTETIGVSWIVRDVCRVDERTQIAVGDLGNIVRSTNDGKTWTPTRAEKRCAILCVAGGLDQIPWGLLGRESLENRWQTQLLVGGRSQHALPSLRQAVGYAGVRSVDEVADRAEDVVRQLYRWITIVRPPILALDDSMAAGLRAELTRFAVEHGTRVVIGFERQQRGDALLHDGAILTECGALVGDIEFDCRFVLGAGTAFHGVDSSASWLGLSLVHGASNDSIRGKSLATRLALAEDYMLPPRVRRSSSRRVQVLRARLKQQTQIAEAIEHPPSTLGHWIDRIAVEDRQRLTWMLLSQAERPEQIAKLSRLANDRFPRRSASPLLALRSALLELSLEHEWLLEGKPTIRTIARTRQRDDGPSVDQVSYLMDSTDTQVLVPNASGHAAVVSPFQRAFTPSTSAEVGAAQDQASKTPNVTSDPSSSLDLRWQMHPVRLIMEHALASAKLSEPDGDSLMENADQNDAEEEGEDDAVEPVKTANRDVLLNADLRRVSESASPWAMLLKSESPQTVPAARAEHPPRLDGQFDEPIWQRVDAFGTTRAERPIQIAFAYDDLFIYVATRQRKAPSDASLAGQAKGKRDSDLSGDDRLAIGFDLDRDLVSHYELQWTADGRTRDLIDHEIDWNPTWYVATGQEEGFQTTEIAIERRGLISPSALKGTTLPNKHWFLRIRSLEAGRADPKEWMPDPRTRIRVDMP